MVGVRKGAWTKEEDDLLRKCIEKHGEHKWHQVPLRAGLNRCRKSCRLRWLNYLNPNIKRGEFATDEVDLILKLHKLLGNRWSLIAGRLPGRTANDVKNYWNTRLRKNSMKSCKKGVIPASGATTTEEEKTEKINVIRPRPWTFSRNLACPLNGKAIVSNNTESIEHNLTNPSQSSDSSKNEIMWWESLLAENDPFQDYETYSIDEVWSEKSPPRIKFGIVEAAEPSCPDDHFSLDVDLWNLFCTQ